MQNIHTNIHTNWILVGQWWLCGSYHTGRCWGARPLWNGSCHSNQGGWVHCPHDTGGIVHLVPLPGTWLRRVVDHLAKMWMLIGWHRRWSHWGCDGAIMASLAPPKGSRVGASCRARPCDGWGWWFRRRCLWALAADGWCTVGPWNRWMQLKIIKKHYKMSVTIVTLYFHLLNGPKTSLKHCLF